MTCEKCGDAKGGEGHVCAPIGPPEAAKGAPRLVPQERVPADEIAKAVAASASDAGRALHTLVIDPVGELRESYSALGAERARGAGFGLCVAFAVATTIGMRVGASRIFSGFLSVGGEGGGGFLKLLLGCLVLPAAFVLAALVIRKALRAAPPVAADVFTVGLAQFPLGLAVLLAGALGGMNVELIGAIVLTAACYFVLLLYAGLTGVGGLSPKAGAPAVPVLILAGGWLSKVVLAAIL